MDQNSAEKLAINVLVWMAGNDDLVMQFLNQSGCSADDLRARSQDPEFLGFVLDFLLSDDDMISAFCEQSNIAFDVPLKARAAIAGGQDVHWT